MIGAGQPTSYCVHGVQTADSGSVLAVPEAALISSVSVEKDIAVQTTSDPVSLHLPLFSGLKKREKSEYIGISSFTFIL